MTPCQTLIFRAQSAQCTDIGRPHQLDNSTTLPPPLSLSLAYSLSLRVSILSMWVHSQKRRRATRMRALVLRRSGVRKRKKSFTSRPVRTLALAPLRRCESFLHSLNWCSHSGLIQLKYYSVDLSHPIHRNLTSLSLTLHIPQLAVLTVL